MRGVRRPGASAPDGGVASRILAARLIAAVPLAIALALGSIRLVFVTYRELTAPIDVATPIAVRVLRGSPEVVVAMVVAWMLAEIVGAVAARRIALADAGVGAGLAHALRRPDPRARCRRSPGSGCPRSSWSSSSRHPRLPPPRPGTRWARSWTRAPSRSRLLVSRGRVRRSVDRRIGADRRRVRLAGGRLDGRRGRAGGDVRGVH